ncbi:allantoate amidohydrolase [[Pantoea] beijingensis]|uniref:allantoate amidohydrolase n=1 Tax=[Pantoea] beijingensis TaxID=1324864 RepID=UPI000FE2A0C2|nr:allantoate amidohydrolase [[Pantoea] beijingensis]
MEPLCKREPVMNAIEAQQAAARVMSRCDALAEISETAGELTRVYLSPEHMRANTRVGEWMEAAGMRVWQDSVGNICGRYEAAEAGAPAILLGSHLDTVRNAGRYDGMLGVLAAIETVHYLHQNQQRLPLAIEIIGFADEEGARFGITLLGSRGITGSWPDSWRDQPDSNNITVAQAMRDVGLDADRISQATRQVREIVAYLEVHIEQGPCLEQAGLALGVVTAINGARRLNCCFSGEAGHAGTVPMLHRKDALAAAAEWMVAIEQRTLQHPHMVATVGALSCSPGAVNVIPGEVNLTLDIRGPADRPLADLLAELLSLAEEIAQRRGIRFCADEFYHIAATRCDERLQMQLAQAVEQVQGRCISLPSGAGHDAIALAERWPVGMLFVRCDRGISHHPAESVQAADVALAIQACVQVVNDIAEYPHPLQDCLN